MRKENNMVLVFPSNISDVQNVYTLSDSMQNENKTIFVLLY